jgi:hypothetical protein
LPTSEETVRDLLWSPQGKRKLPSAAAFDRAVAKLPRGALWKMCEFAPGGPIYFIPTKPFLRALATRIRTEWAPLVLEVGAGDGHLAKSLQAIAPDLQVVATDSAAWEKPRARMSQRERRTMRLAPSGLKPGPEVLRLDAVEAIQMFRPDVVIASWIPPGPLLGRIIRAARLVLEIGAGSGITGDIACWKYPHEFCEELEALGRCRLDERPAEKLHSRVTLYAR